jgi:alpha-2-macroglobulin
MKPAGFEASDVRSGWTYDGLDAYQELRDEKVAFFVRSLPLGRSTLRYTLVTSHRSPRKTTHRG